MRLIVVAGLLLASVATVLLIYFYANQGGEPSLTGILTEESGNFFVGEVQLSFGPDRHVTTGLAPADYDGDGVVEIVEQELLGLVGTTVTVENTRFNNDSGISFNEIWNKTTRGDFSWLTEDSHFDVHLINGQVYRDPDQPPPWSEERAVEATPATPGAAENATPVTPSTPAAR